ncbi:MAG: AgmX/PglI C-terminal domain-containing protein, partial [Deltaproteobacteria bacterium]|nr:AgmX/PglI C-terminal domain-containing protein [Deltaproteobacteria bacterium]
RAARERAVIDLLTDGHSAESLPLVATDPGADVAPHLGEELELWLREQRDEQVPIALDTPVVTGALDPDIVRRIAHAHVAEVRSCYRAGLTKDPELAGRVEIELSISATGSVTGSKVSETTLTDQFVGKCIAKAAKRWKFPKPSNGLAVRASLAHELGSDR